MTFSGDSEKATQGEVLRSLASINDLLGVARPVILVGKRVFQKACDGHLP